MNTFTCSTPAQTRRLGSTLGRLLEPGDTVALVGKLGAGKTTFTRGIGLGAGLPSRGGAVRSPSYVFAHEHHGRIPLVHIDLYRIDSPADADELGCDEYLAGAWAAVIEWADRAPDILPREHLRVEIETLERVSRSGGTDRLGTDRRPRRIRLVPSGPRCRRLARTVTTQFTAGPSP